MQVSQSLYRPACNHKYNNYNLFKIVAVAIIGNAATMTVSTSSPLVGIQTNYTILITNHANPSHIQFRFGQWAPNRASPFQSDYKCYLGGVTQLSCTLRLSQTAIYCALPLLGSQISIILTKFNNPSSTKPLPVFADLTTGSLSQTLSGSISVPTLQQFNFFSINYNTQVAATSTSAQLFFFSQYYFNYDTILTLNYDPNLITLNLANVNTCIVTSSSLNSFSLSKWNDTVSISRSINPITITNPAAAIDNIVLSATLFFMEGVNRYQIALYTYQITITSIQYTSITGTSTLQLGIANQAINIDTAICRIASQNKAPTNTSYTIMQFNTTSFTTSNCASLTDSGTIRSCLYATSVTPKQIGSIQVAITASSSLALTVTGYTYFAYRDKYYPLCSGSYAVSFIRQRIPQAIFNRGLCNLASVTGILNSDTTLVLQLSKWQAGDRVIITGILGTISSPWAPTSTNNQYQSILATSNLLNTTHIKMPIPYTNPTFITILNQISTIQISRPSLNITYAQYPTIIPTCQVTTASTLQSLTAVLSNSQTYQQSTYTLVFDANFGDYMVDDYVQIQFTGFDGGIFLGNLGTQMSVFVNLQRQEFMVVNDTKVRVVLLGGGVIKSVGVNQLVIYGIRNPAYKRDSFYGIKMLLYNGATSSLKQQGSMILPAYTLSSIPNITLSNTLPILTSNYSVTLTLTNAARYSYFSAVSSILNINLPFTCTSVPTDISWPSATRSISMTVSGCNVPFLLASNARYEITESVGGQSSTYTSSLLVLQCPDNCMSCSTQNYCTQCVNITHSNAIFLHDGQCYSTCPSRTFTPQNLAICQSCFETCQTCSGASLIQCSACITYFTLTTISYNQLPANICISTCGDNKYFDNSTQTCEDCEIDCKYCIDKNYCFVCKDGASIVTPNQCDFTSCEGTCATCEGQVNNCTSCSDGLFLYNFQCFENCPEGTYPDQQTSVCILFTGATLYFPATICSIVLLLVVCVCNKCIDQQLRESGRQNISIVTYCSAIFAYMQLFAILIIVVSTPNNPSMILGIVGLAVWLIANIGFCLYYNLVIKKDVKVAQIIQKMGPRSKCIYYLVLILSIMINLRTYRILYCGLFKGVTPYSYTAQTDQKQNKKNEVINIDAHQNQNINAPSESESIDQPTKFQLKRPITLYLTILSLLGSFLFMVAAVVQITDNYFINMLLWGLDMLIVALVSLILTVVDIWAGLRRSYLYAIQKGGHNNETMENLHQEEENTQKKILQKNKTTKKINRASPVKSPNKKPIKSPLKKKISPPKKFSTLKKSNKSQSPKPKSPQLSPQQKQLRQKSDRMKRIKSQYSDLYKRKVNRYQEQQEEDSDDNGIPDVKIFESIDFNDDIDIRPSAKPQKVGKDNSQRQMKSLSNLGATKTARNMRQTKQISQKGQTQTNLNWKLNDIFLGFVDAEGNDDGTNNINDEKKTVKFSTIKQETISEDSDHQRYDQNVYIQNLDKFSQENNQQIKKKDEQNEEQEKKIENNEKQNQQQNQSS